MIEVVVHVHDSGTVDPDGFPDDDETFDIVDWPHHDEMLAIELPAHACNLVEQWQKDDAREVYVGGVGITNATIEHVEINPDK